MWELEIHVILYLIEIYSLMKYLVKNAENSISETLDFAPSALASVNITLKILYFSGSTSNYASPSLKQSFSFRSVIGG